MPGVRAAIMKAMKKDRPKWDDAPVRNSDPAQEIESAFRARGALRDMKQRAHNRSQLAWGAGALGALGVAAALPSVDKALKKRARRKK